MTKQKELSKHERDELLQILKTRFDKNKDRHPNHDWNTVELKLTANLQKLWSINEMEKSGGEPDLVSFKSQPAGLIYCDCSTESPAGRRSLCYDQAAWDARKANKPGGNALKLAEEMGIELLNEEQYHSLQELGKFDLKTSSWLLSPTAVRKLGGAIFGDYRFGRVFIYHNGADSYYAARGFRGFIKL